MQDDMISYSFCVIGTAGCKRIYDCHVCIEEFLFIEIQDSGGVEDDTLKSIKSFELITINDTQLQVQLHFTESSAITTDLTQPDIILVKFNYPMIDADTKEPMQGDDKVYKQVIRPQMTKTELKDFEELLSTAASGGTSFTVLELVACLSVK